MSDFLPPPPSRFPPPSTVRMFNPENGKTGDIHPNEVDNMKSYGWRLATDVPPPPEAEMTDADLRKAIFEATGNRPGPNTKRETLLEQYQSSKG